MTALLTAAPVAAPIFNRRYTRDEYHRMHEWGWFDDQHVEFIDGEVVLMPRASEDHSICLDKVREALALVFPKVTYWVRAQMPLDLSPLSEPLPDVAVVAGQRGSSQTTPQTALLVVEVSESTLSYARGRKASLFAAAGIADYWVIDVNARRIEVCRRPVPSPSARHGFAYADRVTFGSGDIISPLAAPHAALAVTELLP